MTHQNEKLNDRWFRFIGIPLIALVSHVVFFNEQQGSADERFVFWEVYLIAVAEAVVLWEVNRLVLLYFRKRYPSFRQSRQRIIGELSGCLLATIAVRYLNILIYDKTLFWGYVFSPGAYLYNIFVGVLYVAIVAGIYEGIYSFQKWKQLLVETEALKRENLQSQLASLKTQINPHFLFNNLSSLSSLIVEDQDKAVSFVNELSSVYRYLLQANKEDLTTLQKELVFLRHFFHLLKTRFGNGIALETAIDEEYLSCRLPPLTLQLLVENAVKHNAILPNKPLQIRLFTDAAGRLVIVNNLQKKSTAVLSHQTGLQNILSKYRLLHHQQVIVQQTTDSFQVTIPLIKTDIYETLDCGR